MDSEDYTRLSIQKIRQLQVMDFDAHRNPLEADLLADKLLDGLGHESLNDHPGVAWALTAFDSLSAADPQNEEIASKFAAALIQFREHDTDRAALQSKLERLHDLHRRFPNHPEIATQVGIAANNMALSEWARAEHPDLAAEAGSILESLAQANPGNARLAMSIALGLQQEARTASTEAQRSAAIARIKEIQTRFPTDENIRTIANVATPSKAGCYVATAVYGSYNCPEVWVLRRFRDQYLRRTPLGRALVATYYFLSPPLVRRFGNRPWFGTAARPILNRLIASLRTDGIADTPYFDARTY